MQRLYFQSKLQSSYGKEQTPFAANTHVAGGVQLCFFSGIVKLAAAGYSYMCTSMLMWQAAHSKRYT